MAAFVRIGWPLSIGIDGRIPSESVAALPRIPQAPACVRKTFPNFFAKLAALGVVIRDASGTQLSGDDLLA